jgi:hypothetical protein
MNNPEPGVNFAAAFTASSMAAFYSPPIAVSTP